MGDWDPFADPAEQVEEPAKVVAATRTADAHVAKPALDPSTADLKPQAPIASRACADAGKSERSSPATVSEQPSSRPAAGGSVEKPSATQRKTPPGPPREVQKAAAVPPVLSAEAEARVKEQDDQAIALEVQRLKAAKQRAVEDEEFEEAAVLKRRIGVLEASLGKTVPSKPASDAMRIARAMPAVKEPEPAIQALKPAAGQLPGREALREMPSEKLKLCAEERDFIAKSKAAMLDRSVTDDTVNGVPQWAYRDAKKEGFAAVLTDRPTELAYKFKGQIEDEKWEAGVDFQTKVIVQVPVEVAFGFITSLDLAREAPDQAPSLNVGPGASISHHASGTAQLTELLGSEMRENECVSFRISVVRPKVPGKVKLEAAQTVTTKEAFKRRPFYVFKSVWKLRPYPAGGTEVTRVVREFKQYELPDFDALMAVSRNLEVENEQIRTSWSVTVAVQHQRKPAPQRGGDGPRASQQLATRRAVSDGEMYSASFVVPADVDRAFNAIVSNELLYEYHWGLGDDSFLRLDEHQMLIRQINGIALLVTARGRDRELTWMTVAHIAGKGLQESKRVTTANQVLADPFYRVTTNWVFSAQGDGQCCIRRTMRSFKQEGHADFKDLANVLTEAADGENRKLVQAFAALAGRQGHMPGRPPTSVSTRAKYAMRKMPELLDHAAKNQVLEVREMLEVKGADPNYIHVRQDSWAISDSRLIFYEEITPLIAAAENGATDVIKVLFDHPQLDANLVCCAYNDMEIYNYFTAYDMTISRRQPHAAALLRARGVLPASNEHVDKPVFDEERGRPDRGEEEEEAEEAEDAKAESQMPPLPSSSDPRVLSQIRAVAETLRASRRQPPEARARIFRSVAAEWHPDKHRPEKGGAEHATRIFQWLQSAKEWYLEAEVEGEAENQALADLPDMPDRPTAPKTASQYRNASGSVFAVW